MTENELQDFFVSTAPISVLWREPVPQACSVCKGTGERDIIHGDGAWNVWPCDKCPTIGQLLLWGYRIAVASPMKPEYTMQEICDTFTGLSLEDAAYAAHECGRHDFLSNVRK